jgi:hypothetical protein
MTVSKREPVDEARHSEYGPMIDAAVRPFTASVRQLFIPADASGLEVTSLGSVVLVAVEGQRFVLTAGHVAAARPDCAKYVMAENLLVGVVGFRHHPQASPERENFDVALAQLDFDTGDRLVSNGCEFLELYQSDFSPKPGSADGPIYTALGYPHSMTKRVGQRALRPRALGFSSGALEPEAYTGLQLSPQIHLAIYCDHEHVRSDKGVHSLKALDGMSGGALLRLPSTRALAEGKRPAFAGIVIEHDRRRRAMIAVRVEGILAAMRLTTALWA